MLQDVALKLSLLPLEAVSIGKEALEVWRSLKGSLSNISTSKTLATVPCLLPDSQCLLCTGY